MVTRHDESQSYALYLPKAYTPEKKWPILHGFSPAGRGTDPEFRKIVGAEAAPEAPAEPGAAPGPAGG